MSGFNMVGSLGFASFLMCALIGPIPLASSLLTEQATFGNIRLLNNYTLSFVNVDPPVGSNPVCFA